MRAALCLICASLACACLAACGGGGGNGRSDRQQIAGMLDAIDSAMARGDYTTACQHFSQRQQSTIAAGARRAGLKASSCAGALTALTKATGITSAQLAQTFAGGGAPKLRSVSVHGNQATATYTDKIGGHSYTETDVLVREGGQWKADRILRRTQTG